VRLHRERGGARVRRLDAHEDDAASRTALASVAARTRTTSRRSARSMTSPSRTNRCCVMRAADQRHRHAGEREHAAVVAADGAGAHHGTERASSSADAGQSRDGARYQSGAARGSWDALIVDDVLRGEYGALDVRGKVVVDVGAHIGAFSLLGRGAGRAARARVRAGREKLPAAGDQRRGPSGDRAAPRRGVALGSGSARACAAPSSNARNTGGGTVIEGRTIAGVPVEGSAQGRDGRAATRSSSAPAPVGLLKIDAEGSEYPILGDEPAWSASTRSSANGTDVAGSTRRCACPASTRGPATR
jgi:hypothetical protein